jgi:hypothetical protein
LVSLDVSISLFYTSYNIVQKFVEAFVTFVAILSSKATMHYYVIEEWEVHGEKDRCVTNDSCYLII